MDRQHATAKHSEISSDGVDVILTLRQAYHGTFASSMTPFLLHTSPLAHGPFIGSCSNGDHMASL